MSSSFGGNPLGYTGINVEVNPPTINAQRAPTSNDIAYPIGTQWINGAVSPRVIYEYTGGTTWQIGGEQSASTTVAGIVRLATVAETIAGTSDTIATTPAGVAAVAIAGAPLASEGSPGIAEIATQAETNTGTDDLKIVTPLKLKTNLTTPPAIGGTTPNTGAFTTLTGTAVGAAFAFTSDTSSTVGVTGAGVDLTLSSSGGQVIINGEEAAANAVRVLSAAGGLDVDVALLASITSSRNNAQAILIEASAGGIDITAAGAAGEDIDIVNTGGSVNISATESAADSITIVSTAGGIDILASGAAAGEDIDIVATGSSVNIRSTENVGDAVVIESTAGGIQILASGAAATEDIVITSTGSSIRLTATESATDAINIEATLGGVNILASGAAAGEDINLIATGSSVNLESTENAALAVYLHANGGTSETIRVRSDQGTGAASIDILSDDGGITLTAGLGTADAINLVTSAAGGGIDIDAGTAGIAADSTGAIVLTSTKDAAASLYLRANGGTSETVKIHSDLGTGAASVDILSDVGGITLTAGVDSADAINIVASNAAGGIDIDAGTAGVIVDTTGAISLDAAAASNFTVTGAFDVSVISTAGSANITAGEDAADAIVLSAGAGGIDILATGAAGQDIDIVNTGGSVNITATENAADSIVITSTVGGIDILAAGAGAGEDIDIIATGSSINITATEAAANAIVLTASNAAGGIDLTTGGGSIDLSSAGSVTAVAGTDSQAGDTCTVNKNLVAATFTGFTTAAAASQVFNVTDSVITTSSQILGLTLCNEGANDAQMTVQRVKRTAGQLQVTAKNNGAAALNGNVTICFWAIG